MESRAVELWKPAFQPSLTLILLYDILHKNMFKTFVSL